MNKKNKNPIFNVERMDNALKTEITNVPDNLTREEKRKLILERAEKSKKDLK